MACGARWSSCSNLQRARSRPPCAKRQRCVERACTGHTSALDRNFAAVKQSILGVVAWLMYRLLSWTWRITWHEPACMRERLDQRRPFILAHWHGDELALL